jgi:transcriptional regulator with XRE-family HTH domain
MSQYRLRGERLTEIAAKKGDLTGYAIARRTGLAESTISRLRRGVARPTTESLLAFVRAYDTTIDELVAAEPSAAA